MSAPDLTPEERDALLTHWCATLVRALETDGLRVDIDTVLALAGAAANAVVRPAAPLTTFVAGYAAGLAVGSGSATPDAATAAALETAFALCRGESA